MGWSLMAPLEKDQQVRQTHNMDRLERLKRIQRLDASMPSEFHGSPDEQEIAILEEMVRQNLTQVEENK